MRPGDGVFANQEQQVLHLRKCYPLWGKRKLWRVLVRERGWTLSESTVGRIVARLVRLGRVEPVSFYYGQVKPKRRRQFTHHAKRFLAYLKEQAPFPIRSLQVDGGSEFRDEFEQACQEAGIPLYVLPPKKPEYNGCVERANGTSLYEFYPYRRGALDGRRHQSKNWRSIRPTTIPIVPMTALAYSLRWSIISNSHRLPDLSHMY